MARYLYECGCCGKFTLNLPMGEAEDKVPCPAGTTAVRLFSRPYITTETFLDNPANKNALKHFDANRAESEKRYAQRYA